MSIEMSPDGSIVTQSWPILGHVLFPEIFDLKVSESKGLYGL
jgi:hypothetical protein